MKRGTCSPSSWIGIWTGVLLTAAAFTGCGIAGALRGLDTTAQQSVAVLNQGIHEISVESANWRFVLEDMQAQLVDDAQSTLRHEIAALLQRGVAATGSEAVCVTDAIPKRIIHALKVLKAEQLGEEPPTTPPTICMATPDWIDLNVETIRQPVIHYYGYDLADEFDDLSVALRVENGQIITLESNLLSMVSDYEVALNVSRIDPQLLPWSTHLILSSFRGTLSEIPVVKSMPPPKKTKNVSDGPVSLTWTPPHTAGDEDFNGNGPEVDIWVSFKIERSGAYVRVYMDAEETKGDWTRANGWSDWQLFYEPPPSWEIIQCTSPTYFPYCIEYTDDDHDDDLRNHATLGAFRMVGDTKGDDAGKDTRVTIDFKYKLNMVIREI